MVHAPKGYQLNLGQYLVTYWFVSISKNLGLLQAALTPDHTEFVPERLI